MGCDASIDLFVFLQQMNPLCLSAGEFLLKLAYPLLRQSVLLSRRKARFCPLRW
jgi:hypothetical protein